MPVRTVLPACTTSEHVGSMPHSLPMPPSCCYHAIHPQMATALYFIDKLALRAGHEKDEDEADTVGCCTLKARPFCCPLKPLLPGAVCVLGCVSREGRRGWHRGLLHPQGGLQHPLWSLCNMVGPPAAAHPWLRHHAWQRGRRHSRRLQAHARRLLARQPLPAHAPDVRTTRRRLHTRCRWRTWSALPPTRSSLISWVRTPSVTRTPWR